MGKVIKNFEELSKIPPNKKYKIEIGKNKCNAWILPIKETRETEKDYWKHHKYLSTHTFYGNNYDKSTKLLKKFGFDVEIENWDK